MSVEISSLVWKSCLPHTKRYICAAMADQANDEGYCIYRRGEDITQEMIAEKTGLNVRTVRRHIGDMLNPDHKFGVLEIIKSANHHSPPEYRLRPDKLSALKRKKRVRQTGQIVRSELNQGGQIVRSEGGQNVHPERLQGGQPVRQGGQNVRPHIRCLDVDSRRISLSESERDFCVKELKRLFPSLLSIPKEIPIERAYLFLHKVRTHEIKRADIISPVAFMLKMRDEDISGPLQKERERRAAGKVTT